ncbi:MAG: exodeoxyribonuclease VII small subunit [Oscillospiraceae bacterium]|nr:exodeoxyribonuclease VII small subunit [Oscillospiraceae bacterium]MBQ3242098.1 exodeoxyribonuclease VII small subunit [Oscillospiraceae bacterium]MBQ7082605.1 exodeoxyribonuclease VII small subunit [Oscillospiraceae bacterium]MBR2635623.1 exodeoxyribonuclease VII small subunit [Oscillospiraceae bacterium]
MAAPKKKNELSLEAAMVRIEEILKLLDSQGGTLDESLALFEEGTSLVRFCNDKLQQAKLRVKEVVAKNEADENGENPAADAQ